MNIDVRFFAGESMRPHLPALARLRIAVFRDWPYLYDGTLDSEQRYLAELAASPRAGLAVAFEGSEPVGCSTCLPLTDAQAEIAAPFRAVGLDPARYFYFGESVLLPRYRGQGIGVAFFREREAHARRTSDADYACFCAVERPADHPLRPPDAVPLTTFWQRRGYTHRPDLACTMRWKQVDTTVEVENRLSFWIKPLRKIVEQ
jgi:GNAT superfamily N-acetyltransferase